MNAEPRPSIDDVVLGDYLEPDWDDLRKATMPYPAWITARVLMASSSNRDDLHVEVRRTSHLASEMQHMRECGDRGAW